MNRDKLVTMANQIGAFFAAMPDREQARRDIAAHLARTWEPRLRRELAACLDRAEGEKLTPLVREAVALLPRPNAE